MNGVALGCMRRVRQDPAHFLFIYFLSGQVAEWEDRRADMLMRMAFPPLTWSGSWLHGCCACGTIPAPYQTHPGIIQACTIMI